LRVSRTFERVRPIPPVRSLCGTQQRNPKTLASLEQTSL
jgi:hypothetical protein